MSNVERDFVAKADLKAAILQATRPIISRIEELEAEVFGRRPPGGPGLAAQLKGLERRLSALDEDLKAELSHVDAYHRRRLRELTKIVAELQEIVRDREAGGDFKTMTAGE